jgi:hypothetical protein
VWYTSIDTNTYVEFFFFGLRKTTSALPRPRTRKFYCEEVFNTWEVLQILLCTLDAEKTHKFNAHNTHTQHTYTQHFSLPLYLSFLSLFHANRVKKAKLVGCDCIYCRHPTVRQIVASPTFRQAFDNLSAEPEQLSDKTLLGFMSKSLHQLTCKHSYSLYIFMLNELLKPQINSQQPPTSLSAGTESAFCRISSCVRKNASRTCSEAACSSSSSVR